MTEENSQTQRNLGKSINTWVQTMGILIAAAWGVYTFVYKEITVPKSAPVNITLNLQLKKIGTGATQGNLMAVEMRCSATNPSSRPIYLLPSAWIAYGVTIAPIDNDANFDQTAVTALSDSATLTPANRHAGIQKSVVVATGRLLADTMLKPGETAGRTIVFYVQKAEYDLVDLTVAMPSTADARGIALEWTLGEKSALVPAIYRLSKDAKRTPMTESEYSVKPYELQQAQANAEISLWPD
jgi:hypothetical protein